MDEKEKFIRDIINAFSIGDTDFLLGKITSDFSWVIVGEKTLGGKTEFFEALEQMQKLPPVHIDVHSVLNADHTTVVEGVVVARNKNGQSKQFGFCDLYQIVKQPELKIKSMTSYVIDVSKHKQYKEHF